MQCSELPVLSFLGSFERDKNMDYPHLSPNMTYDDLIEYFTLTQDERYLLSQWRPDVNILGFTVLLKSFQYLGYPPIKKEDIKETVISLKIIDIARSSKLFGNIAVLDN